MGQSTLKKINDYYSEKKQQPTKYIILLLLLSKRITITITANKNQIQH